MQEEEKRFSYEIGDTKLVLGGDNKKHGLASLQVAGTPFDLIREPYYGLNLYRIMYGGALHAIARTEPLHVRAQSETGMELEWASTSENPCRIEAVYTIVDESTIDVEVTVEALAFLPKYEISVSTYVDFALEPYAVLPSWPGKMTDEDMRLIKVEDHPYIKGHYMYFPRDNQAALTRLDGRWIDQNTGKPIAHFVTGAHYGRPVGVMANDELYVIQMGDPETCGGIGITYSSPQEDDSIRRHNAVYVTLYGDDLSPGKKHTARIRQVLGKGKVDLERVLAAYDQFRAAYKA